MIKNQLKMSRKEVDDYSAKNLYTLMRLYNASDDYIAARCCILNGLVSGFGLACQAIEKILKAFIYLETREELKRGHDPFKLKEKLKKAKDYGLDKYDNLLKKLNNHYKSRYYENKALGASSDELDEIDELWVNLIEKIPMPDEVKYRTKFFAKLFEPSGWLRDDYFALDENKTLKPKMEIMRKRYDEIFWHLYPNSKKATPTEPGRAAS